MIDATYKDKIIESLLSLKGTIALYWDRNDGWKVLMDNIPAIDSDYYSKEGIFGLRQIVADQDKQMFDYLLAEIDKMIQGAEIDLAENRLSREAAYELSTSSGNRLYKINTYIHLGAQRADGILFKIEQLDPEESYRYGLARIITNDKNPESFNLEVKRLFEGNPDTKYAVVQFDIAGFKFINKQYGEAVGDELLAFIINCLKYICNDEQLFVRLTADVFMILTPYDDEADIISFIEKIKKNVENYNGLEYRLVFGIDLVLDKTKKLRVYGDGAAVARQNIKRDALRYYEFFNSKMSDVIQNDNWIENQMEKALANGEFVMYLQPKYSISDSRLIGAEALVRWIHPKKGIISPLEFIPLFEKNGFVVRLDRYIWEQACKCISGWVRDNNNPIPISVNMSRKHLKNTEYIGYLDSLIERYNIDKKYLEIEITETFDDDTVAGAVDILKEHGYTLLMDDFGSGFSSLNTLKDTRFDILKIDRGFLADLIDSSRGKSIVKHTIIMAKDIGLDIIAEGVENKGQAMFLSDCGCDKAQGYYYAKPVSIEEFEEKYHK